jgi:outer membrane protein assembly factor BamD
LTKTGKCDKLSPQLWLTYRWVRVLYKEFELIMLKRLLLIAIILGVWVGSSQAFWMWTPESGKWTNPKNTIKETPQAQLLFALDFYKSKNYKKANQELQKLLKTYPRAREAADAQYYLALIQEDQGQLMAAFKSYQVVINKYPFSERSAEVVKRQFEIGNALLEGKDNRSKFVEAVAGGEYDVVEVFRAVIKNAPYGELAAPAQYKIGLYLLEKQMYQEARDEFEKTRNDYPDSEWAKAAKFQIALSDAKRSSRAQYNQKITNTAVKEFQDFVQKFPDAELSKDAKGHIDSLRAKEAESKFVVAQFYAKQKKLDSAKFYYTTIVNNYPDTVWAKKAIKALRHLGESVGEK